MVLYVRYHAGLPILSFTQVVGALGAGMVSSWRCVCPGNELTAKVL